MVRRVDGAGKCRHLHRRFKGIWGVDFGKKLRYHNGRYACSVGFGIRVLTDWLVDGRDSGNQSMSEPHHLIVFCDLLLSCASLSV